MQTTLYEVKTKDDRTFKVFCANKHQSDRFREVTWNEKFEVAVLENGIHNIKQWEDWTKVL